MPVPALSIVIPWCDRSELGFTLDTNWKVFAALNAEVIVVNSGGAQADLDRLLSHRARGSLQTITVGPPFNKALAVNVGVAASRAKLLFVLDADIQVPAEFFAEALRYVSGTSFVTVDRVKESESSPSSSVIGLAEVAFSVGLARPGGPMVGVETSRVRFSDGTRSGLGLILLTRNAYREVGGMHSGLSGWGWEDFDLVARLQLAKGLIRHQCGQVLHHSHGDDVRAPPQVGRETTLEPNLLACLARYGLGDYLGTYAQDRAVWLADTASRR
jgi:hypothetical protein